MTKHVLIVEDEPSIRDTLLELFETPGTHVSGAATLPAALEAIWSSAFDLIVTDIRLEGQWDGGLQVIAAASMLGPSCAVVALTAYPDDANRLASERLGVTYFLEKPADLMAIATLASTHGVPTSVLPVIDEGGGAPTSR